MLDFSNQSDDLMLVEKLAHKTYIESIGVLVANFDIGELVKRNSIYGIKALLQANPSVRNYVAYEAACQNNVKMLKWLETTPESVLVTCLKMATERGALDVMKYLFRERCVRRPEDDSVSFMEHACLAGNVDSARWWYEEVGCDPVTKYRLIFVLENVHGIDTSNMFWCKSNVISIKK